MRLPDKGRAIKGLAVCNDWDLEPLVLLNGLALGCYQPTLVVLIVYVHYYFVMSIFISIMSVRNKTYYAICLIRYSQG